MLDRVGIPDPQRRVKDYPHAFSGGMRQRAMIAMALAQRPEAAHRRRADDRARRDDPGADPRPAPRRCSATLGMAVVFVTHDLGVVADICDRVRGDVRGPGRRGGDVDASCSPARATRTPKACSRRCRRPTPPGEPLTVIPGQVPEPATRGRAAAASPTRCDAREDACTAAPVELDGRTRRRRRRAVHPGRRAHARGLAARGVRRPATTTPSPTASRCVAVRGLRKDFPVRSALAAAGRSARCARSTASTSTIPTGRDARARGRVGLGQVDARRALVLRLLEPTGGTTIVARRRRDHRPREARACATRGATCRWCSRTRTRRSTRADDRRDDRRAARGAPRPARARARDDRVARAAGAGGAGPVRAAPLPVRVLRRPAAAHRDRARARARPEAARARRAGQRRSTCRPRRR